jgi:hypothetical protein
VHAAGDEDVDLRRVGEPVRRIGGTDDMWVRVESPGDRAGDLGMG